MSGPADKGFGAHPFGEIARATVAAQERSLELAQAWTGSLQQLVADQAEGGRAALEALTSTLAATERALASQEEANKALRQSLEAYREVIERASATQERSARLVTAALDSFAATTQAQLELTRAFLAPMSGTARGLREHGPGLERRLPGAARAGLNHPSRVMPGGLGPGIVAP